MPSRQHTPPTKQSIAEALFARLLDQIAGGVYPPGSRLPTEREIALREGVARASVREALQDLERAGVVSIRQGSGACVCERRLWSFRVLPAALRATASSGNVAALRDLVDLTLHIRHEMVLMTLTLADGRFQRGALSEARQEARLAWENRDTLAGFMEHDLAMDRAILAAAKLEPVIWLLNDVSRVYLELVSWIPGPVPIDADYLQLHENIFAALESGNGLRARDLTLEYVGRHERRIRRALGLSSPTPVLSKRKRS